MIEYLKIYNFESKSIQRFKLGVDYFFRVYSVSVIKKISKKKQIFVRIKNVINGKVLLDNLNLENVRVNSNPIKHIQELQDIVFNNKCNCEGEEDETEIKIFDLTFDETFE